MFTRFTPAARQLMVEARTHQRRLDHRLIGTEHLLLALAADDGPSGRVLRGYGLDLDRIESRLADLDPRPDPDGDAQLLQALGIDLDEVRRSVEQLFGPGALDRARDRRRRNTGRLRWPPWGRTATTPSRFGRRSKRVLELSLREALRLKTKHIGPEHIGLAILREGEGLACLLLSAASVPLDQLRRDWEAIAVRPTAR